MPVVGRLMDLLNPLVVRIVGANINRRTVENLRAEGLVIEEIEDLGSMKMVKIKMMIARPGKARVDAGGET